jgi:SAM-dependent methyltransferase
MAVCSECRVCRQVLPETPLLRYEDMPRAAQYFPVAETLAQDIRVTLNIVQCSGCGLVQLDNPPVPYYREVIRASAFSEAMRKFRQQQFSAWLDEFGLRKVKAIEVGCGRGEYLQLLLDQGLDAYGLEQGDAAVADARKQGLRVQQGYVDCQDYRLQDGPFQAFFMFNFLEHFPEPMTALRGIAANLSDGAYGLVEVPNFDMMLREQQFTEFVTDHLNYFTRETLSLALQLSGFDVLRCEEIWGDYILSASVRKRAALPLAGFQRAQNDLTQQLDEFIAQFPKGQVAVWGAGHQALAVIAMTGLKDKIAYVIDSAVFKQNKLTPATHLPIVAPQQFYRDQLQGLIIMAAAYSDEVAGLVAQQMRLAPRMAILRSQGLEILPTSAG